MSATTTRLSYEVFLTTDVAEALGVDSPVETDRIDFYDSGLWVTTADGRDFYPYENVLTIHERPVPPESTGATVGTEPTSSEGSGEAQD